MSEYDFHQHLRTTVEHVIEPQPWGRLEWYVSAAIGNSTTMTVGKCVLDPDQANGRHCHPNCDEILTVLKGRIIQHWDDQSRVMVEGDVVSIPSGVRHSAHNIGAGQAELAISFSSAHRQTVGAERWSRCRGVRRA
ncbi:cupin domain-containing protein [Streptomyces sp. NPDC058001]|uniref:cupin domain-containing protein n=1 Tax=Streptomyces sp. NPDC058001 TaxID=3346300 RepID=UPI0036E6EFFE